MKRILLIIAAILAVLVIISLLRNPTHREQWGRGYEAEYSGQAAPVYHEPDHGYLYYWMLYHVMFQQPQPTYHIYVPPYGYPATYRPWRDQGYNYEAPLRVSEPVSVRPQQPSSTAPAPTRQSDGFSRPATPPVPAPSTPPTRTSDGFSRPATSPAAAPSAPPTRTSDGFSRPNSSPPPPSRPSSPPPSRSSGGFSGGKR